MAETFDDTSWKVLLQRIGEQGVTPFIGAGISPAGILRRDTPEAFCPWLQAFGRDSR